MNQLVVRDEDIRFLVSRDDEQLRKLKIQYDAVKGSDYHQKMFRLTDRILQEREGVMIIPMRSPYRHCISQSEVVIRTQ